MKLYICICKYTCVGVVCITNLDDITQRIFELYPSFSWFHNVTKNEPNLGLILLSTNQSVN